MEETTNLSSLSADPSKPEGSQGTGSREVNATALLIRRGEAVPFIDRFGERRLLHRGNNGKLAVKRERDTLTIHLNQVVAKLIGHKLRAKRREAGLTLEQLCLRAGIAGTTPKNRIWTLENAPKKEGMRLGTLYALAVGLDCDVAALLPTVEEVKAAANVKAEMLSRLRLPAVQSLGVPQEPNSGPQGGQS